MNIESATYSNPRLIYLPQQQGRATRTFYGVVTFLAWVFYVYLWMPLTTLALWVLGVRFAYLEVYLLNEPLEPPAMLRELPLIALCCAVVLIGWAEYNRRRFQGKERRHPQEDAGLMEIAAALHASPALGTALHLAKSARLEMDPRGRPLEIQVIHPLDETSPRYGTERLPAVALAP
jgi:biofilm PGA synthesis protein PgaD